MPDLMNEFKGFVETGDSLIEFNRAWCINSEMTLKFGDGNIYKFRPVLEFHGYDYKGEDGFYYNSAWFDEEDEILLELDDGDFLI